MLINIVLLFCPVRLHFKDSMFLLITSTYYRRGLPRGSFFPGSFSLSCVKVDPGFAKSNHCNFLLLIVFNMFCSQKNPIARVYFLLVQTFCV